MNSSFHRRVLPCPPATEFSSPTGREMFAQALSDGTMGCFFRLIEQFRTQDEPAFCGLGTLTMVLNALNIDPMRTWKGPWRWFNETMLDCCEPLERIKQKGVTFPRLACLARCNGAVVEELPSPPADSSETAESGAGTIDNDDGGACGEDRFRRAVISVARGTGEQQLIVSYSRKEFLQTGDGHFSPVGGYHAASDSVLILDVARFKYPPHWVPLTMLWRAMQRLDPETGLPRGYMVLSARAGAQLTSVLALVPCGSDATLTSPAPATDGAGRRERELDLGTALRGAFRSALEVEVGRATAGGDGSVVAVALRTALRAFGSCNGSVAPALRVTYRPSIRDGRGCVNSGTSAGTVESPAMGCDDASGLRTCCGDTHSDVAAGTDHDSTDQARDGEHSVAGAGITVSSTGVGDVRITRRQDVQSALLNIARSLNELAHDAGATSSQQLQAPALAMAGDAYESEDLAVALLLAIPPTLWASLFPEKHAREATALEQLLGNGPEQLLAQQHEALRTEVSVLRAQVQELVFSSSLGCSC